MKHRHEALALGAALIALAAVPTLAHADTYCVHQSGGCDAGTIDVGSNLQDALDDADANAGADTVEVGAGTYTGNFTYSNGLDPVTIVGVGPQTVLTEPAVDFTTVLHGGTSVVNLSQLRITLPSGATSVAAAQTAGDADHVTIDGTPGTAGTNTGLLLWGAARVSHSDLTVVGGSAVEFAGSGTTGTVTDSTLGGWTAILAGAGTTVNAQRIVVNDAVDALIATGGTLTVGNSVLSTQDNGGLGAALASCGPADDGLLVLDHVTLVGPGAGFGLYPQCGSAGRTATLSVTNSIVRGFGSTVRRAAASGGVANATIDYSDLEANTVDDLGGAGSVVFGAGVINADPLFAGPADLHLGAGSPAIDAGAPGAPADAVDLDGLPRLSGVRQDLGAYEVQQPAPPLVLSGGSGAPQPQPAAGTPVASVDAGPAASTPPAAPPAAAPVGPSRAQLLRMLRQGHGRRYTFTWPTAGSLTVRWNRPEGAVVGRGTLSRSGPGRATVVVRLTARGRRFLRRHPHARLAARATFTPAGGAPAVTVTGRLRVR
jgi:hypothetical protein